MVEYLEHGCYPREGLTLDVGALWEISSGANTTRDLVVIASADSIRIRDMLCGEWEMAERAAVDLSVEQSRALGEILLAAADVAESRRDTWRTHGNQADPRPALKRAWERQRDESASR